MVIRERLRVALPSGAPLLSLAVFLDGQLLGRAAMDVTSEGAKKFAPRPVLTPAGEATGCHVGCKIKLGADAEALLLSAVSAEAAREADPSASDAADEVCAPCAAACALGALEFFSNGNAGVSTSMCGALRLARYNCLSVMPDSGNSREFLGFPIPASAAMVASLTMFLVWLEEKNLPTSSWRWVLLAVLVFLSVMMVSEVKYPSFKKLDFRSRRPFTKFVVAVVVIACFVFLWKYLVPIVLPLIFTSYLVYGFVRPRLSRKLRREIEEDFDDE